MSKLADHMFLNVIDTRFGSNNALKKTILFERWSFKPSMMYNDGFTYHWNLNNDNINISGCGVVINPAYADKSEEEICLICAIENPVMREDVQKYIDSYAPYISHEKKDTLWKIFEETNR